MSKYIKVNKFCEINQDHFAKSREDDLLIAVNVIPVQKEEKGFINYCLAIENEQKCCEEFDAKLFKINKNIDFSNVFVSKIERDVTFSQEEKEEFVNHYGDEFSDYKATKIYDENDELIAVGVVENYHNGYYSHLVYEKNGEIHYDDYL